MGKEKNQNDRIGNGQNSVKQMVNNKKKNKRKESDRSEITDTKEYEDAKNNKATSENSLKKNSTDLNPGSSTIDDRQNQPEDLSEALKNEDEKTKSTRAGGEDRKKSTVDEGVFETDPYKQRIVNSNSPDDRDLNEKD